MDKLLTVNVALAKTLEALMLLEEVWDGLEGDVSDRYLIESIENLRKAGLELKEYKKTFPTSLIKP